MIKIENITEVQALRDQLSGLDPRFASTRFKLYLSQDPIDPTKDAADQLRASKDKVLIETLPAGTLGLPQTPRPVLDGLTVPVLHPSILVLTKLKRWAMDVESTRPKTKEKNAADAADMEWMIIWLANNDLKIGFEQYAGKTKEELLPLIRKYRDKFADKENLMAKMKAVLGNDWDLMRTEVQSHPHDVDVTD